MSGLFERLDLAARTPVLLVATDYDGTLAPIVGDPASAVPQREALVALAALSTLPDTHAAVISGRALTDLAKLTGAPEGLHLVGSHGSEFDPGFAKQLTPGQVELRRLLEEDLRAIAGRGEGLAVEAKPASIAFHYRNASEADASKAVRAVLEGPAARPMVHVREGKRVIELSVLPTDKGSALEAVRHRVGATAAVFLGDDRTDEDAFACLTGPDVAVKVGDGVTRAPFRVSDPEEVARVLAYLSEARTAWLAGESATPIEEHSMLSDQRTIALVDPCARITWLCTPRIDSPALFAELLGGPTAGSFSVRPSDGSAPLGQGYYHDSLILETRWRGLVVTDYLDCSVGRPTQRAGRTDLVRVLEGQSPVEIEFAPRADFGRTPTRLEPHEDGLLVRGVVDPIVLRSPGVEWRIEDEGPHQTALARVELDGRPLVLELRYGAVELSAAVVDEGERRRLTFRHWRDWVDRLQIPSVQTRLVRQSALVLRGLVYGPTGAISAAATTSLPEDLGGVRNWDYRYGWVRDAALAAHALLRLGTLAEAMRFLDWVLGILDRLPGPERLRPLYTVSGGDLGPEAEIAELSGYAGSRPVRVGNLASTQVQLDVFGPIVDLVLALCERGAPLSTEHWRLVESMVQAVERRWREPDHGIWEIRLPPRRHVHSKVMCWTTIDRAIRIAERFRGVRREEWEGLRDAIAREVLELGWKPTRRAFTTAYESDDLDAAALWVGLSGLLPPGDERFVSTVDAIQRELTDGPIVYRYRIDDGLPGTEGGFLLCASWLVDALLLVGRTNEALRLFDELCGLAGPSGCMAEQYDPSTRRALGNHPQAYSHAGLVLNAIAIEEAMGRPRRAIGT